MICLRKNHKQALYYDEINKYYIKTFTPKLELKMKYWLRLRNYPGLNFAHIAKRFEGIGINTPTVVSAEKYQVVTKEIVAPTVREYLAHTTDDSIENRLIELISTILNAGIIFFDFHYDNFLYKNGEIYAIDLEGYTDSIFVSRGRKGVLYRIEKHLGADFRKEVEKRWSRGSFLKRLFHLSSKMSHKK